MSDRSDTDSERPIPRTRTGQGPEKLDRAEFERRLRERYVDPAFDDVQDAIAAIVERAWDAYVHSRKSPRTRKAGPGFADPDYDLSLDWLAAREAIRAAAVRHGDAASPSRLLIVCGSPRNDKTCPGENAKSFRLVDVAREIAEHAGVDVDVLDLSLLTSEFGRTIHPCKACVSTAMPLCHWPCSCYPNHSLGQTNDWMNEIYPRWVAAHGVLIVTPVHWYQSPSALKLMIDRLVCADGGNPDPTSTHGKKVTEAKRIELDGWDYPRHLAGRRFGVVVHGDVEGADDVRRALSDWLASIGLVQAGAMATIGRYIGYYEPYATSHDALDADAAVQEETRNVARALVAAIARMRAGESPPDAGLEPPRDK